MRKPAPIQKFYKNFTTSPNQSKTLATSSFLPVHCIPYVTNYCETLIIWLPACATYIYLITNYANFI